MLLSLTWNFYVSWILWHIQEGGTSLTYAAAGGHVKAVHVLLDSGAMINKVQLTVHDMVYVCVCVCVCVDFSH